MFIIDFFTNLFRATSSVADATRQRDGEVNTASQRSNAEAAQVQKDKDKAVADIANPDQTQLNKDVAP